MQLIRENHAQMEDLCAVRRFPLPSTSFVRFGLAVGWYLRNPGSWFQDRSLTPGGLLVEPCEKSSCSGVVAHQ